MLSAMKRLAEVTPKVAKLLEGILPRQAKAFAVGDLPMPVAVMAASLLGEGPSVLVTPSPETADQALADAAVLLPGVRLLPLSPADDEEALLTGGRMAQVRDILAAEGRCLIVASIHALLQPVPDPKALDAASKTLRLNEDFPFDTLAKTLTGLGYEREELVVEPLTFALRGGILDVWPAGAAQPIRAEFFGDTVDGLRAFDPATQCSVARLEHLSLPPAPSAKIKTAQLLPQRAQGLSHAGAGLALAISGIDEDHQRHTPGRTVPQAGQMPADGPLSRTCQPCRSMQTALQFGQ